MIIKSIKKKLMKKENITAEILRDNVQKNIHNNKTEAMERISNKSFLNNILDGCKRASLRGENTYQTQIYGEYDCDAAKEIFGGRFLNKNFNGIKIFYKKGYKSVFNKNCYIVARW